MWISFLLKSEVAFLDAFLNDSGLIERGFDDDIYLYYLIGVGGEATFHLHLLISNFTPNEKNIYTI
jgi:hypothetical protein